LCANKEIRGRASGRLFALATRALLAMGRTALFHIRVVTRIYMTDVFSAIVDCKCITMALEICLPAKHAINTFMEVLIVLISISIKILALRCALKFYHAPQDLDLMVIHLIAL